MFKIKIDYILNNENLLEYIYSTYLVKNNLMKQKFDFIY